MNMGVAAILVMWPKYFVYILAKLSLGVFTWLFVCLFLKDALTLVGHSRHTVLTKHDVDGIVKNM